jgi:hypothetical protein
VLHLLIELAKQIQISNDPNSKVLNTCPVEYRLLAEIHLKEDPGWMIRVANQADRIAELEK